MIVKKLVIIEPGDRFYRLVPWDHVTQVKGKHYRDLRYFPSIGITPWLKCKPKHLIWWHKNPSLSLHDAILEMGWLNYMPYFVESLVSN